MRHTDNLRRCERDREGWPDGCRLGRQMAELTSSKKYHKLVRTATGHKDVLLFSDIAIHATWLVGIQVRDAILCMWG